MIIRLTDKRKEKKILVAARDIIDFTIQNQ